MNARCEKVFGGKAVMPKAETMQAMVERRFTEQGARAGAGAVNPYRIGTAAATWWQRGNQAQA